MNDDAKEKRLVQQISWALQRQLAWAGLFLASLVGIIRTFSEVKHPFSLFAVLYYFLVFAVCISINQITKHVENVASKEYELNPLGWSFNKSDWSFFQRKILREKCDGSWDRQMYRIYLIYLSIISFFIILLFNKLNLISQKGIILTLLEFVIIISSIGLFLSIHYMIWVPKSKNRASKNETIRDVICDIAQGIGYHGLILNERYLHHYFSHLFQERCNQLNLKGNTKNLLIHPEWPTFKKGTGLKYAKYKKINGRYQPHEEGSAGFIDFAIGDYDKPEIGIEFSLKYGWSNEEIVYDFLKLLDKKNPFITSFSYNIIYRLKKLVTTNRLKELEDHMEEAFKEAEKRLTLDRFDKNREYYFIFTEIDRVNKRRHWHYNRSNQCFQRGLP